MNRSRTNFLAAALIAGLLCAVWVPAMSAATLAKETPMAVKPSSCYTSPEYPLVKVKYAFSEPELGLVINNTSLDQIDGPPYTVYFSDMSVVPGEGQTIASRYWNFGDGSTSAEKDPVHTYKFPGDYSVLLSVTSNCGSQYTKKIAPSLKIYCTYPVPSFTSDVYEGVAPLTVHITDTSSHAPPTVTTWTYTFDSLHTSHDRNPVFTYTEPGTYTITQTVTKSCVDPISGRSSLITAPVRVYPSDGYLHGMPFTNHATVTTTLPETPPPPASPGPGAMSFSTPPATANTPSPQVSPAAGAPQGVPAAPATGTLSVVTDPPGAALFIDDVTWGASPASIPNLAAGSHTLRLEKAGYQTMRVPIVISDGKTAEYVLNLIPDNPGGTRAAPLGAAAVVIACAGAGLVFLMRKEGR